jgi:hypothetical protein
MKIRAMILMLSLFKAIYLPAPDADPEYGQGAIERNELAHREIERFVWLIDVPPPADAGEWQCRLNAAVDSNHGSFRVIEATAEEKKKVESGEITLQR